MANELVMKLDNAITTGLEAKTLQGFDKAFTLAGATAALKTLLTPATLKDIMALKGTALGFKTDKDNYSVDVVRNCLIEAVLTGVQPVGNQFNIIAGNCYITKEGFGHLLKNLEGLRYEMIPELPRIQGESAVVKMNISWKYGTDDEKRVIEFPIKTNKYMGPDAVIGKATRKARAWLYNFITGNEINDGDAEPEAMIEPDKNNITEAMKNPKKLKTKQDIESVEVVDIPADDTIEITMQENGVTEKDIVSFADFKGIDVGIIKESMQKNTKAIISKIVSWKEGK